jgi:hypothetical protein
MTTLAESHVECAVCGKGVALLRVGSSNTMQGPDLDTRPGEMMRSTIGFWIEQCPACGYAAPAIEEAPEPAAAVVRGDAYQALRRQAGSPEGVRKFLLHAHLLAALGHPAEAGWTSLHAAWVCDDAGDDGAAAAARRQAIALWKQGKARGISFMEDLPSEFALATDVLRRAGEFDQAREACLAALDAGELPPLIEGILRFELALIGRRDAARHSLAELKQAPGGCMRVALE